MLLQLLESREKIFLGWFRLKCKIQSTCYHKSDMWREKERPEVTHPHGFLHCPAGEGDPD